MGDLISIIVPVYKTEQYLRACIDSIVGQTHKNLEIILVNDGSPDNSPAICYEYAANDSRVKVVDRENGGLSAARNSGLEVATGDYIAFVDSDDIVEPCMYEILLRIMNMHDASISQCGATRVEELLCHETDLCSPADDTKKMSWRTALVSLMDSSPNYTASVWNKLYRKELFEGIRFADVRSEDYVINYELLREKKPEIAKTDMQLYHYIKRSSSITTGSLTAENFRFIDRLYQMEAQEKDPEFLIHWKIQKAISARNILIRQIVSGSFPERYRSLRNDMIGAKFIIFKKEYRHIEKSLRKHILMILLAPRMYNVYIKMTVNKAI